MFFKTGKICVKQRVNLNYVEYVMILNLWRCLERQNLDSELNVENVRIYKESNGEILNLRTTQFISKNIESMKNKGKDIQGYQKKLPNKVIHFTGLK